MESSSLSDEDAPLDEDKRQQVQMVIAELQSNEQRENECLLRNAFTEAEALFNIPYDRALPITVPPTNRRNVMRVKRSSMGHPKLSYPLIELRQVSQLPRRPHYSPSQISIELNEEFVLPYLPYIDQPDKHSEFEHESVTVGLEFHLPRQSSLSQRMIAQTVGALQQSGFSSVEEILTYIQSTNDDTYQQKNCERAIEEYICSLSNCQRYFPNIDSPLDKIYPVSEALDAYMKLYCPVCMIYDCFSHPKFEVRRPRKNNMPLKDYCSDDCFLNLSAINPSKYLKSDADITLFPMIDSNRIPELPKLSNNQLTLLSVYMDIYRNNYCAITTLMQAELSIKCYEVYLLAQQLKEMLEETLEQTDPSKQGAIKTMRPRKRPKKCNDLKKIRKQNFEKTVGERKQYVPCYHPGQTCEKCDHCTCKTNGTCCEKYCGCRDDCTLRFMGCACKRNCRTNQCSCYLAHRECDADRCKCHAGSITDDYLKCNNCPIQRCERKHLMLGVSRVAGWGVFLNDTAQKNELISEYCGELVDNDIGDLKGIVYDKTESSFLFSLNNSKSCDAKSIGNKIRYANHDPDNPNCYPRVVSVNGFHRVGLYARRNINKHEEILFNYGTVKFIPVRNANRRTV